MSERGSELMTAASRQLDEMAEFFSGLDEADLRRPCPDDDAGDTVGAVAAHAAEGYHHLGRLLRVIGDVGEPPAGGHGHGPGQGRGSRSAALPELLDRLAGGKAQIGVLTDLTDVQLVSVPAAGNSRFCDGDRSLQRVIVAVIAHQGTHLVSVQRALV